MDLSTTYMGFTLPHPLIPGAGPLVDDLDTVRRLEDAGAPMIVMRSLFEEQIVGEELAVTRSLMTTRYSNPEAQSYLPDPEDFELGPREYLEQIRRIKAAVSVPVIASLNGTTPGGWLRYAWLIEEAGADGLELNLYELATSLDETGADVERRGLEIVRSVKNSINIPVAVKLSPFYSSIANYALRLEAAGADALVLFNRFYQPDIDVEQLELLRVNLSSPAELNLRLRWIGVLSGRIRPTLAVSGGVHAHLDAIKAIMAGAHAVQMVSTLLRHGPERLRRVRDAMADWLEQQGYESLGQMRGSMSLERCADPKAYERANYMRMLQGWEAGESAT
ncbi:MAG: dihydroorotate dehydrogenase-like protein [Gemmataceae bacterium]